MRLIIQLWYWQQLGNLLALAERRVFAWRAAYEARSPVMRVALGDEDDLPHYCGECHHKLEHVRPGKYQCVYCEAKNG